MAIPAYPSAPLLRTHPHALGGLALLHGLAPPARSRILDIGCGAGRNLCWIAATMPPDTERFLGVDIDPGSIESAQAFASMLQLTEVEFRAADFLDLDDGGCSEFDFILVNGLYSWVPADVRADLLRCIGSWLSEDGIAFVSFHNYRDRPWREQLLRIADPLERMRKARLLFPDAFAGMEDGLLFHDALAGVSDPVALPEFQVALKSAARARLEYLCDASGEASSEFHEAVLVRSGRESIAVPESRIWWVTPQSFPSTVRFAGSAVPEEVVQALSHPRPLTISPGPCPKAWIPAVLQASQSEDTEVFNYYGALVDLSDAEDRQLLCSLDGSTAASGETIDFFARAGLLTI